MGVGVFFFYLRLSLSRSPSSYIVIIIIIIIPVLGSRVFYYIGLSFCYTLLERLFCYYSDVSECAFVRKTERKIKRMKQKNKTHIHIIYIICNSFIQYTDYHLVPPPRYLKWIRLFIWRDNIKLLFFFSLKIITYTKQG